MNLESNTNTKFSASEPVDAGSLALLQHVADDAEPDSVRIAGPAQVFLLMFARRGNIYFGRQLACTDDFKQFLGHHGWFDSVERLFARAVVLRRSLAE